MLEQLTPTTRYNSLQELRQPLRAENDPGFQVSQNLGHLILQLQRNKLFQKSKWTWKQIVSQLSYHIRAPIHLYCSSQFSSVAQSSSTVCDPMDCSTPGFPVHHQLTELLKFLTIESVISPNHLILCHPLPLPPSIFSSMRVFSNESVLCIRWPMYWSFSFSISPFNEYSGQISLRIDWKTPVFFIFIREWLLYNMLLLSVVQQSEPDISIHIYISIYLYLSIYIYISWSICILQGCILSPYISSLYAEYNMKNAGLDEAQAGIKIARRTVNNLRYADDTILMAESEEELKSLLR